MILKESETVELKGIVVSDLKKEIIALRIVWVENYILA